MIKAKDALLLPLDRFRESASQSAYASILPHLSWQINKNISSRLIYSIYSYPCKSTLLQGVIVIINNHDIDLTPSQV
jgi:hypothetical protein